MLIHGSELVAVAQGLVEYRDLQWIFSAGLYDIISQKSEHVTPRGMSRASRERSCVGSNKCVRRNLRPSSVPSFSFLYPCFKRITAYPCKVYV